MQNIWTRYQGHGVQMVAVVGGAPSDPDAATWLKGLGVTFPAIHEDDWIITNQYWNPASSSYPQNAVIDRNAIVQKSITGLHDEATLEGHLLDVIWMRDPVDIELVMDVSGSMASPAPGDPGGDAKLLLMQRASNIVANYLTDNGQSQDRMGLVWFESDVRDYTAPGGGKLVPVQANAVALRNEINASTTGDCTAMGAGLQTAFNTLESEGVQDRFAILCTDGMQNVDPMVTKVGSHYEIIDGGGHCAPHSSVAAVPGTDITTYNTRVHTIGVGITASYSTLLQEVASQTGGFYTGTDDPETDLDLLYMVDLCHCMAGGSPKVSFHSARSFPEEQCYAEEHFFVNRTTRKITVVLAWQQTQGCELTFWLYGPGGKRLDLHRQMKHFGDHCLATVYMPTGSREGPWAHAGRWRMVIRGEMTGGRADYHAFVICEDRDVKLRLEMPRKIYQVGDLVPLHVQLDVSDRPVSVLHDLRLETAFPRLEVAEAVSQIALSAPAAGKVRAMAPGIQAQARFQKLLRPVRKLNSLAGGDLECSTEGKGMVVPIKLSRPGLHTFKVDAFCEVEGNGPVARTDVFSVMVGPAQQAERNRGFKGFLARCFGPVFRADAAEQGIREISAVLMGLAILAGVFGLVVQGNAWSLGAWFVLALAAFALYLSKSRAFAVILLTLSLANALWFLPALFPWVWAAFAVRATQLAFGYHRLQGIKEAVLAAIGRLAEGKA